MDCLFLEPFLYLYYQYPIVADRSGPIPTNVWPPPPSVDVLFNRQRTEFLSKRVFYPWGGQIPRYASDLGNVIYEQDCLPLWVPKPKVNMYHVLESFHSLAEQPAPLPSIHPVDGDDNDNRLNASKEQDTTSEILGYCHIGTQLAEDLMDEIATLPDLSMSTDGRFAFFADHSGFGKALDIQPFVRGWLGNGTAPGLSPWSPCYTDSNNPLFDNAFESLVDSSDPDLASTPTSPDMNDTLLTSSITSTTTAPTNLMTPRSEVDLFSEAIQDAKASIPSPERQYPGQDDSDGESDELIVVPRLWNLSVLDLTGDTSKHSPSAWSPPITRRSYEDNASAERVHSPVQSILDWRDGTTNSRYVASSANVTYITSENTILPCVVGSPPIVDDRTTPFRPDAEEPDTVTREIDHEHPTDHASKAENYEVIVPEATVVHVDEPTSRWLYGILREQEDDEEGKSNPASSPSSTSSLGSELSSHCQLRLGPRAAPLWGPPPNVESIKGSHLSLPTNIRDMDDFLESCPSNIQRRLSCSRPPSTMHEEILTWITSPEAIPLPTNQLTEPDFISPPNQQRKPSLFSRLLRNMKRGPIAVRRLLPSARWLSYPLKLLHRERKRR